MNSALPGCIVHRAFLIATLLCPSVLVAQNNPEWMNFLRIFPTSDLPVCISYGEDEFHAADYQADNTPSEKSATTYRDHVLPKPDSLLLSFEMMTAYLLADTEKVTLPRSGDLHESISPNYFAIARILAGKHFYCLVYERQFNDASFHAEKFLCTLTSKGKLIDPEGKEVEITR